jgi:uncharacterized protein (TIGR02270 family)
MLGRDARMVVTSTPLIDSVVQQHADGAASLRTARSVLVAAPHVTLRQLAVLDQRLAAHLDGLAVAGERAWHFCDEALAAPTKGDVFAAGVRALDERAQSRLDRLFLVAEAVPETRAGLASALGWVAPEQLRGIVVSLLGSDDALRRLIGVAACSMHRVDPGIAAARRRPDPSPEVQARVLRTTGELGLQNLVTTCAAAATDTDPLCGFWGAWAATILGDRGRPLQVLAQTAATDGPHRIRAFVLALQAMNTSAAHQWLKRLAIDPKQVRWLIHGSGIVGTPVYVPWLIQQMRDDALARIAGEAFVTITGIDLADNKLDRPQPEGVRSGPSDDPDDDNVDMDPDDGLPWPDADKIAKWWEANSGRFQSEERYFIGAAASRRHCIDVLKNGSQRQRILAAHYLCLLDPGTPLFNTSAPAWRQQRLLADMK